MSTNSHAHTILSQHTFGRTHIQHPPLPQAMQQGQSLYVQQMGEATAQSHQLYAGCLPHDFDHLVRSVGEW